MNHIDLKTIFYFLLFSLINFGSAHATTVFGPQEFTIHKGHFHFSYQSFATDTSKAGELILSKTTPDKQIRAGFILLNNQFVQLRSFLNGDHKKFTKKIHLKRKNRLMIFLRGEPGAIITAELKNTNTINPPETQLTAEPTNIILGESSKITWITSYADTITITPKIGRVSSTGSISVSPHKTTKYTLTAHGAGGTTTVQTKIKVTLPPPLVTITAQPDTIAPGSPVTLLWNSEYTKTCTIEPDIGAISTHGSTSIIPKETTNYTITAIGPGGTTQAQVLVQLYPIRIQRIDKSQAHYTTPENTLAASSSALLQHDLEWFHESFTSEAVAYEKQLYANAGIDLISSFDLIDENDEEFIVNKEPYKDGLLIVTETITHDIDGTILTAAGMLILENDLWKITFKYSDDEELDQYDDIRFTKCIANFINLPFDLDDYCWHDNNLTNLNKTAGVVDKRKNKDLLVASLNGIDNGFSRETLNDMPREQISMGGWIKADSNAQNARIIEIGQDQNDSTAITMDAGNGFRYWVHINGNRIERTAGMDYDFHDNQWHHVYLTYDGSSMKLYVDVELKDSHPVSGTIDSTPTLNIGQHNSAVYGGTSKAFKGYLDDLQIYNKSLTTDEILFKFKDNSL